MLPFLRDAHIPLSEIDFGDRSREDYGSIEDLSASIEKEGLLTPLTVQEKEEGGYLLLAGGRRYRALEFLGITDPIDVRIKKINSFAEAKEVELFENLMRKNPTWQERDRLIKEINDYYAELDEDWTLSKTADLVGRTKGGVSEAIQLAEAMEFIPELGDLKTEDEAKKALSRIQENLAVKELRKRQEETTEEETSSKKRLAKVLIKAEKAYSVGDVFEGLESLQDGDKSIFMAEVDPPYGIELKSQKRQNTPSQEVADYIEIDSQEYAAFLKKLVKELYRVLPEDGAFVFWFGIQWYSTIVENLETVGFFFDRIPCIWYKHQGQTNDKEHRLGRVYELFLYGSKSQEVATVSKEGRPNIFDFAPVYGPDKIHPTQRPTELITEIINTFGGPIKSHKRRLLVPFLGSGASIIAANSLKLDAFGWDLNPDYRDKFLVEVQKQYEKKFLL